MKSLTFFNNLGGVGKTTLTTNIGWMFAELGVRVLLIDLDPQMNLSNLLMGENTSGNISDPLFEVLRGQNQSLLRIEEIRPNFGLIQGNRNLAFLGNSNRLAVAARLVNLQEQVFAAFQPDVVFFDLAPSFDTLTLAALMSVDMLLTPLTINIFSSTHLQHFGDFLREIRQEWKDFARSHAFAAKSDTMQPAGYVFNRYHKEFGEAQILQESVQAFHHHLVGDPTYTGQDWATDPFYLGTIHRYVSLDAIAYAAHKAMFAVTAADGALGGILAASRDAYWEYQHVMGRIAEQCGIPLPDSQAKAS